MKNIGIPIFSLDDAGSKTLGVAPNGRAEIYGGAIISAHTRICAPLAKIPPRDAKFFGINNAIAQSQPPFSDSMEFFCAARRRGIFCSHNAPVEDALLRATLPTPGIVSNPILGAPSASWDPRIDSCALFKKIFPTLGSAKLSDAVKSLNLEERLCDEAAKFCPERRRKWHCALYDALAAALILIKICELDGFEDVDLPWLLKYSNSDSGAQPNLF